MDRRDCRPPMVVEGLDRDDDDDTTIVIHDGPVVIAMDDVATVPVTVMAVVAVHLWMTNDGVEVVSYVRRWRYRHIDGNQKVGRTMVACHDAYRYHQTELEHHRIVVVEVHKDDDHGIDDHNHHDRVGPDLHDDGDHIPQIRRHCPDHPEDDIRSQNFLRAIHWVEADDDEDAGGAVMVVAGSRRWMVEVVRWNHSHTPNDAMYRRHWVVRVQMDAAVVVVVVAMVHHDDWWRTFWPRRPRRRQRMMGFPPFHWAPDWSSLTDC